MRAAAENLAPVLRAIHERYPGTLTPPVASGDREREARRALNRAVTDLYNPAQLEVLRQAYRLAHQGPERESGS